MVIASCYPVEFLRQNAIFSILESLIGILGSTYRLFGPAQGFQVKNYTTMKRFAKASFPTSLFLVLLVFTSCSSPIGENEGLADLSGKVVDESGSAEVGSIVEILELQETTSTDENGHYSFMNLAEGNYTVLTRAKDLIPSFRSLIKENGVQLNSDFTLKSGDSFSGGGYEFSMGESHTIGNVTVSFSEVLSDSRCAVDATCVWEGSGRIQLNLESNGQNLSIFIDSNDLNDFTTTVEALGIVFRLNTLNPLPELGEVIDQGDYSVNVEIN